MDTGLGTRELLNSKFSMSWQSQLCQRDGISAHSLQKWRFRTSSGSPLCWPHYIHFTGSVVRTTFFYLSSLGKKETLS